MTTEKTAEQETFDRILGERDRRIVNLEEENSILKIKLNSASQACNMYLDDIRALNTAVTRRFAYASDSYIAARAKMHGVDAAVADLSRRLAREEAKVMELSESNQILSGRLRERRAGITEEEFGVKYDPDHRK